MSIAVLGMAALLIAAPAVADDKLMTYGRHLSRECTTCHRADGVNNGIPSIIGWPADTFIATMKFYRDGTRSNPVMISVASSLSDEQLQALATFFASMPKAAKKEPAASKKIAK